MRIVLRAAAIFDVGQIGTLGSVQPCATNKCINMLQLELLVLAAWCVAGGSSVQLQDLWLGIAMSGPLARYSHVQVGRLGIAAGQTGLGRAARYSPRLGSAGGLGTARPGRARYSSPARLGIAAGPV